MKTAILSALVLISASSGALASEAALVSTGAGGAPVVIALDAKGTPRENGHPGSWPTIKDFRNSADYPDACYRGSAAEARTVVEALVNAANGDGDSWAELQSIDVIPTS